METPISAPENHYFRISGTSTLHGDGTLTGEFTLTAEGQSDASVRGIFTRNYKADWQSSFERELVKISSRIEIVEMNYTDPYAYLLQPVQIKVKYRIPNFAIATKDEIIFTPVIAANLFGSRHSHISFDTSIENRLYPFADGCSKLIELNETITLPANMSIKFKPESKQSTGNSADFESSYTIEGNTLKFAQKVVLKKRIYQPEEWFSFRDVVKYQNEFASKPIILKY